MDYDSAVADLEIVAGNMWSAVGGPNAGTDPIAAGVHVKQVEPGRFGIEVAAATRVTWEPGHESDVLDSTLSTLRPFKPLDMIISEFNIAADGTRVFPQGCLTAIKSVEINGVQQFTSKQPIPSCIFGSILTAPRPRIQFDTVQTAPVLTLQMMLLQAVIAASQKVEAWITFAGVAVKR
jgi:hypothetical protein